MPIQLFLFLLSHHFSSNLALASKTLYLVSSTICGALNASHPRHVDTWLSLNHIVLYYMEINIHFYRSNTFKSFSSASASLISLALHYFISPAFSNSPLPIVLPTFLSIIFACRFPYALQSSLNSVYHAMLIVSKCNSEFAG